MTLHPLLVLLGIFGGLASLGPPGLLVGPLLLSLAVSVLEIYRKDFSGIPSRSAANPETEPPREKPVTKPLTPGDRAL
jgi:predicted PurR-regulated permease PerM